MGYYLDNDQSFSQKCHSSVEQSETGESDNSGCTTGFGGIGYLARSSARFQLAKDDTFKHAQERTSVEQ
jgi:hypothetical protein